MLNINTISLLLIGGAIFISMVAIFYLWFRLNTLEKRVN